MNFTKGNVKTLKLIGFMFICLSSFNLKGQDIHFSQPDVLPSFLNPAYTGFFNGDFRCGVSYRNQWATISYPFQTYGLSAEAVVLKRRAVKDGLGIGINLWGDVAGTSSYGAKQADFTVTYFKALGRFNNQFITLGARVGFGQMGFNPNDLIFTQDNALPPENFETTSETYPDLSVGLSWQIQPTKKTMYKAGLAAFHLNQPSLTYLNTKDTKLWIRYLVHFKIEYRAWEDCAIIPTAYYQRQYNFQEIMYGGDLKWFLDESNSNKFTLSAGLYFRQLDAVVLGIKSEYNAWTFGLAYDTNVSGLWKSSYTVGAIELSLLYTFQKTKSIRSKEIPCPVF